MVQRRHHVRMDAFFRPRHRRWKDIRDHSRWGCLCVWITKSWRGSSRVTMVPGPPRTTVAIASPRRLLRSPKCPTAAKLRNIQRALCHVSWPGWQRRHCTTPNFVDPTWQGTKTDKRIIGCGDAWHECWHARIRQPIEFAANRSACALRGARICCSTEIPLRK